MTETIKNGDQTDKETSFRRRRFGLGERTLWQEKSETSVFCVKNAPAIDAAMDSRLQSKSGWVHFCPNDGLFFGKIDRTNAHGAHRLPGAMLGGGEKMRHRRTSVLGKSVWVMIVLFVLSAVPVFAVGTYDRMYADDYDYSVATRRAFSETGDAADVLAAAADTVQETYESWQGTYAAVFLFALQPGIYGQGWYALTPVLLIVLLVAGLGALSYSVCRLALGLKRRAWLLTWAFIALVCVQFPRDASEGFFWYNGGVYYTFFFGLLLLWLGLALNMALKPDANRARRIAKSAALVLLAGGIAGGNYPSALLLGGGILAFLLWGILKRKRLIAPALLSLAVYAAGFCLSVIAPGNAVRQALLQKQSPVLAVVHAIEGTPIRLLGQLLRHPGVMALMILVWIPLCVVFLRNATQRFRWPLALPVVSFLVLAAMFTPSYYAMSNAGPYRLWNIVIFTFYLLIMLNVYYITGWWKRRFPNAYQKTLAFLERKKRLAPAYLAVVVSASVLLSGVGPSLGIERESATSVRAAEALLDDSARAYATAFDRQAQEIEAAASGESVPIEAIPDPGSIIPDGDLTRYAVKSYEPSRWFERELQLPETTDSSGGD